MSYMPRASSSSHIYYYAHPEVTQPLCLVIQPFPTKDDFHHCIIRSQVEKTEYAGMRPPISPESTCMRDNQINSWMHLPPGHT